MIDDTGEIQPPKIIMILSLSFEALLLRRRNFFSPNDGSEETSKHSGGCKVKIGACTASFGRWELLPDKTKQSSFPLSSHYLIEVCGAVDLSRVSCTIDELTILALYRESIVGPAAGCDPCVPY
jgi:hypothetical protein